MTAWHEQLGVFDLETTGIDTETARIVTAHVGVLDASGAVLSRLDWLLDPGIEIPEAAAAVHGVSTEKARTEGRAAAEGVAEIVAAIRTIFDRGIPVVAYNAPYDFTVLDREAKRHGIAPIETPAPIVDPYVLDWVIDRYRRGKRTLDVTAEHYGVSLGDDAHDSSADAVAAGRVAQAMAAKFAAQLAFTAAELHAQQIEWSRAKAQNFQDYLRKARGDESIVIDGAWPVR